jgi:site-specific DNA recombinase
MTKTAIIYARVSDQQQVDDGVSIDSQIDHARKKAEQLEAEVLRVFTDAGVSGRTDRRPAFRAALDFCAVKKPSYFICWSTARFARNKIDAAIHKRDLRAAGTQLAYCSVDIDASTDEGWMFEGLSELWDEYHSRMIAKDTRRSMISNAQAGFWNGGRVPFGYKVKREGRRSRLEIDEPAAVVVREAFRLYLAGSGVKAVATALNERAFYRNGKPWDKNIVTALLRNDVYAGCIVFGRVGSDRTQRPREEWIVTPSHPPIVAPENVAKAQKMLGEKGAGKRAPYIRGRFVFSGLLRCHRCGGAMQSESANGRSRQYHYYNCRTSQKGAGCVPRRMKAESFDAWLIASICDKLFTPERVATLIKEMATASRGTAKASRELRLALERELTGAKGRRSKLLELLEMGGRDTPNLADLSGRLRELNAQVKQLEAQIVQHAEPPPQLQRSAPPDVAEVTTWLRETFISAKNPRKIHDFFASIIDEIRLSDDTAEVIYRPDRLVQATTTVRSNEMWLPDRAPRRTLVLRLPLNERFRLAA